jgi:hypothetical protein
VASPTSAALATICKRNSPPHTAYGNGLGYFGELFTESSSFFLRRRYLVATKLLGPKAGLVSGSALAVDYMLTITISIASSVDALFSFVPVGFQPYKIFAEVFFIFGLIFLNLRGVRESVIFYCRQRTTDRVDRRNL